MKYSEPFLRVRCEKILELSRSLPRIGECLKRGRGTGRTWEGAKDKPRPLLPDPGLASPKTGQAPSHVACPLASVDPTTQTGPALPLPSLLLPLSLSTDLHIPLPSFFLRSILLSFFLFLFHFLPFAFAHIFTWFIAFCLLFQVLFHVPAFSCPSLSLSLIFFPVFLPILQWRFWFLSMLHIDEHTFIFFSFPGSFPYPPSLVHASSPLSLSPFSLETLLSPIPFPEAAWTSQLYQVGRSSPAWHFILGASALTIPLKN